MRQRLTKSDRRDLILDAARRLFAEKGMAGTEMEDIRLACDISRGGLYHHFANKRAVLEAVVDAEVAEVASAFDAAQGPAIPALLQVGSVHLGRPEGVLAGLKTREERLEYLSALAQAIQHHLPAPLSARLEGEVADGAAAADVAELCLAVNDHMNRRLVLGEWPAPRGRRFAATGLRALGVLLRDASVLAPLIARLEAVEAGT